MRPVRHFVIIGFQPGSGAVWTPLANIKVARFDGYRLRYAGAVGTGFSERVAATLRERLDRIRTERCVVVGLKVGAPSGYRRTCKPRSPTAA